MTVGAGLVLLGLGVLVWPVPSATEFRLRRLRVGARVGARAARGPSTVGVDRGRSIAVVGVGLAAVVVGVGDGPLVGLAAGAGAAAVAVVVLSARSAARETRRRRDLLTALAVLRGELDAGVPFAGALLAARASAGSAVAAFDLGVAGPAAGSGGDARSGSGAGAVGLARRSLTAGAGLVAVTGASWSAVAAGIGRDVAAHDAREREVASALAGARASTVVLAGLPALGLGLAGALGADPLGFLLHTGAGSVLLAAGVGLDLLGVLVSTGVSNRAAR